MNKLALTAALLLGAASICQAENEVTVDPTTLRLTIPTVVYLGTNYSAQLGFNGSCFVVEQLLPKSTSQQTNLTHEGFDFSAGAAAPNDWNSTDGYITVWAARAYPAGYAYGAGFWWTPADSDSSVIPIQDMGTVALSSVTAVPSNWAYVAGTGDYPLMTDHVYVVKARDGYAKFKVLSMSGMEYAVDTNWDPFRWTVAVEYAYTSGTSF
jgi:hypothetical protein